MGIDKICILCLPTVYLFDQNTVKTVFIYLFIENSKTCFFSNLKQCFLFEYFKNNRKLIWYKADFWALLLQFSVSMIIQT